jgi:two-component system response regulator YesN
MFRILLVEDEKSIRENIRKGVNWEQLGFNVIGEASNGEQALEMLQKNKPDVLITDIRMPFMDGLKLSKLTKQIYPEIEIIILSGYSEFEYAQEAIKIGVREYIVKPITPIKITRMLINLRDQLDMKLQEKKEYRPLISDLKRTEEKMTTHDLNNEAEQETKLVNFLKTAGIDEIDSFVDEYYYKSKEQILKSLIYCSYFTIRTMVTCIKVIEELGGNSTQVLNEIDDMQSYIERISRPKIIRDELKKIFRTVILFRNEIVASSTSVVSEAKQYIAENFKQSDLMLDNVARHAGISPSHFSYIFKQHEGIGFIKYLTNLRIEKAKEYLKTTNMTNAEIAEMVGYCNANYFSSVFHKKTGMTPKEFQER